MKKKILTVSILLILLAIIGGGTFAAYTYETTAHNVITSGEVKIQLMETLEDGVTPFPKDGVDGVMPGQSQPKQVWVKNEEQPAWIRIKVTTAVTGEDGRALPADVISLDIDAMETRDQWLQSGDYYYYKEIVPTGGSTPKLFKNVIFDGEAMDNAYQSCTITVTVEADAMQAANNPIPEGKTVTSVWPDNHDNPLFDFLK